MKLASSLLKEDGVIYISINEEEYANLKLLCDSVLVILIILPLSQ